MIISFQGRAHTYWQRVCCVQNDSTANNRSLFPFSCIVPSLSFVLLVLFLVFYCSLMFFLLLLVFYCSLMFFLGVLLVNGVSLYDSVNDKSISEFKYIETFLANLAYTSKDVYCAAAEVRNNIDPENNPLSATSTSQLPY